MLKLSLEGCRIVALDLHPLSMPGPPFDGDLVSAKARTVKRLLQSGEVEGHEARIALVVVQLRTACRFLEVQPREITQPEQARSYVDLEIKMAMVQQRR